MLGLWTQDDIPDVIAGHFFRSLVGDSEELQAVALVRLAECTRNTPQAVTIIMTQHATHPSETTASFTSDSDVFLAVRTGDEGRHSGVKQQLQNGWRIVIGLYRLWSCPSDPCAVTGCSWDALSRKLEGTVSGDGGSVGYASTPKRAGW